MLRPPIPFPEHLSRIYTFLRILLWVFVIIAGILLLSAMLFPTFDYGFNFRTPSSSRNTLHDPRVPDNTPRTNGRIDTEKSLLVDANVLGSFSEAKVTAVLEKKSDLPESLAVSLRRSYRAFLSPTGAAVDTFPREDLFHVENTYYALREGMLFPFVSKEAYLSNYPDNFSKVETPDFLKRYPLSQDFIGFRVGSLVSFADGVFLVMSEKDIRPFGSADIFLGLGYNFQNVIPASEEDIGIYKRGRIITLDFVHPDGTLFEDEDSGTIFLMGNSIKHPVTDTNYRNFLISKQAPILGSVSKGETTTTCTLTSHFFPRTLSCTLSLGALAQSPGSDYELTLSNPNTDIDINTLTFSIKTKKNRENVFLLLSQMKQRALNHLGYGN